MNVTTHNFRLSPEQRRFQTLLGEYPKFVEYWDFETGECDVASLEESMGCFSHGERLIASFLLNVWNGNDEAEFQLIDAIQTLDEPNLRPIRKWVVDPFFP